MVSVVLCATVVNRPVSLAASIGAAALVLLLRSPAALLDVSFQLSFASVIGLGVFARWMVGDRTGQPPHGWGRVRSWLMRSFSASIAASLLTMPLVAHHFGEITPAAPLGNLVLVPVVELVVLPFGLVGALLALAHPWLGALPLVVAGIASRIALAMSEVFRWLAPVLLVRYPNVWETLLLVTAVACLLQALMLAAGHRRAWFVATSLALLLAAGSLGAREQSRRVRDDLRVTFLDVGQGSSILIQGPKGFAALVDGGGRYDDRFDTGARIVEPVLRAAGITRLDLVVLTHAHPDHLNGLLRILDRFTVGALWTNRDAGGNPTYAKLLALAGERRVPTPIPGNMTNAGLTIEAIGPWFRDGIGVPPGLSTNDGSLVVRLEYGKRRVLLPGDVGSEGETELLDRHQLGSALAADVLAMPHHGSRHGSSGPFLDAVTPVLSVASAGRFNRFGLPHPATLERYAQRGITVLRTDQTGAVTVTMDRLGSLRVGCVLDKGP
jgi:competence protein ComEC